MAEDPLDGGGKASETVTVLDFYARGALEGAMTKVETFTADAATVGLMARACFNVAEAMVRERERRMKRNG